MEKACNVLKKCNKDLLDGSQADVKNYAGSQKPPTRLGKPPTVLMTSRMSLMPVAQRIKISKKGPELPNLDANGENSNLAQVPQPTSVANPEVMLVIQIVGEESAPVPEPTIIPNPETIPEPTVVLNPEAVPEQTSVSNPEAVPITQTFDEILEGVQVINA
jgi:hypothetical protein